MIPRKNASRPTRGSDNIPLLSTKHNFFQNSHFPAAIKKWNRLDIDIRKSDSISILKKRILSFIRPLPNKISNSYNPQGLKLLTRLRLGLSAAVALISKQLFIFSSTAQTLWNVETHF